MCCLSGESRSVQAFFVLQNEYQRLLSGLRQQGALPGAGNDNEGATAGNPVPAGNDWLANPQVPADILQEAVRLLSWPTWPTFSDLDKNMQTQPQVLMTLLDRIVPGYFQAAVCQMEGANETRANSYVTGASLLNSKLAHAVDLLTKVNGSRSIPQVPGNIRRAEHFVHFLRRLLEHMRRRMEVQAVHQESPRNFLDRLQAEVGIDGQPSQPPPSHVPPTPPKVCEFWKLVANWWRASACGMCLYIQISWLACSAASHMRPATVDDHACVT